MDSITQLCSLLDNTIDWESKDLSFITMLKLGTDGQDKQRLLAAINSKYWPLAVEDDQIIKTQEDKDLRAKSILTEFVCEDLANKRFLDYGCGSGECVQAAKELGADAYGYDPNVPEFESINEVIVHAPYDTILCYDVFDHIIGNPNQTFEFFRLISSPTTRFYIRCHPFSSRHGGHTYETFNKAYAHLFMSEAELQSEIKTRRVIHPNRVYPAMFERENFKILQHSQVQSQPEPIIEAMLNYIAPLWLPYKITELNIISKIISIQFCDFVMNKKT